MRVLVVDQDSALLESIVRSLRERFTVDAVTTKADCLDLLRQNAFEVIVAGERLEDGSGLELLGQVAKRWPNVLRIFCADRERLKLLKGRLGPFELFQTLSYPVDPERLLSTLELAGAAREAQADMSNIQHVVLGADETEPDPFPPPQPAPRAPPAERAPRRSSRAERAAARARSRPAPSLPAAQSTPAAEAEESGPKRPAPVQFPPLNRSARASSRSFSRRTVARRSSLSGSDLETPGGDSAGAMSASSTSPARMPDEALATGAMSYEARLSRRAAWAGIGAAALLTLVIAGVKLSSPRTSAPAVATQTSTASKTTAAASRAGTPLGPVSGTTPALAGLERGEIAQRIPAAQRRDAASVTSAVGGAADIRPATPMAAVPHSAGTAPVIKTTAAAQKKIRTTRPDALPGAASARTEGRDPVLPPETPPGLSMVKTHDTLTAPAAVPLPRSADSSGTADSTSSFPGRTLEATDAAAGQSSTAGERPAAWQDPLPVIREAKLIRRTNPGYPSAARRAGIEGQVDLELTVSPEGVVSKAAVLNSQPAQTFDEAALAAVRHWRYDPRFVDGLPAEAHIKVHLEFRLDAAGAHGSP